MTETYCPKHCPTCPKFHPKDKYKQSCPIRGKEWQSGIKTILSVDRRPQGEGERMAEELIHYMKNEFMQQPQEDLVPF